MKSDVAGGTIRYRFDFTEPHEGKTYSSAEGKGIVKFAEPAIGWRIGALRAKDAGGINWLWVTQAALSSRGLVLGISTREPGPQLMWGKFFFTARSGQNVQPFRDWFRQCSGPNVEGDPSEPPSVAGWRNNINGWQLWFGGEYRGIKYNESPDLELWIPDYVRENPA